VVGREDHEGGGCVGPSCQGSRIRPTASSNWARERYMAAMSAIVNSLSGRQAGASTVAGRPGRNPRPAAGQGPQGLCRPLAKCLGIQPHRWTMRDAELDQALLASAALDASAPTAFGIHPGPSERRSWRSCAQGEARDLSPLSRSHRNAEAQASDSESHWRRSRSRGPSTPPRPLLLQVPTVRLFANENRTSGSVPRSYTGPMNWA
jgi:hypothetical protein